MNHQLTPRAPDLVCFEAVEKAVVAESGPAVKRYFVCLALLVAAALFSLAPVRTFLFDLVAAGVGLIGPILLGIVKMLAESAVFLYVFLGAATLTLSRFASVKCATMRRLARECPLEELDEARIAAFEDWSKAKATTFTIGQRALIVLQLFAVAVVLVQFHRDFVIQPIFGVIVLILCTATLLDIGLAIRDDFWHLYARLLEKSDQLHAKGPRNFVKWTKTSDGREFLWSLVQAGLLPKDLECPVFRNFIEAEGEHAWCSWVGGAQAVVVESIELKLQALAQPAVPSGNDHADPAT